MIRSLLHFALLLSITGCHARYKRLAPSIDAVRTEVAVNNGPTVTLPYVQGVSQDDPIAAVVNITQAVRSVNTAAHLGRKVDPDQVNDVFQQQFAMELAATPFRHDPGAGDVLRFELVDWGLEVPTVNSPGVFNYRLRVRGYRADGSKFYRGSVNCVMDAGTSGWIEMTPFGDNNPNRIKNLTAAEVQEIFDATAADCAGWTVDQLRRQAQ